VHESIKASKGTVGVVNDDAATEDAGPKAE
jgi:hypothetical protein